MRVLSTLLLLSLALANDLHGEVLRADNLVLDAPPGWVSVPVPSHEALRLRFSSDPVEISVQVTNLPGVSPDQLEALSKHMLEAGVRHHDEATKKQGRTLSDVKTSIKSTPEGWRLTMSGRDDSPRQFVQVTLVTKMKLTMLYAQSITHNTVELITFIDTLAKGIGREP